MLSKRMLIVLVSILLIAGVALATEIWLASDQCGANDGGGSGTVQSWRILINKDNITDGQWDNLMFCIYQDSEGVGTDSWTGIHICEQDTVQNCSVGTFKSFPDMIIQDNDLKQCINLTDSTYSLNGSKNYLLGWYWESAGTWVKYFNTVGTVNSWRTDGNVTNNSGWSGVTSNSYLYAGWNITGKAVVSGCPAPNLILTSPLNNYHDNILLQTYQADLTYYTCNNLDNLTLYVNNSYKSMNASNLVNGSNSIIWSFDAGEGYYKWGMNVSNSTNTYNAGNNDFNITYDISNPTVNIYAPTNNQNIYYADLTNLNVTGTDTHLFNLTCEVFYANGTLLDTYVNDTGSTPTFTLANEFSSGLSCATCGNISYYINCSAMDSHTNNDKGDLYCFETSTTTETGINCKRKDKRLFKTMLAKGNVTKIDLNEYDSHYEWTYHWTGLKPNFKPTFLIYSDYEITYLPKSIYGGHFVADNTWLDFDHAIKKEGFTIDKVKRINKKNFMVIFNPPNSWIGGDLSMHPATGGLNFGSAQNNFKIVIDSVISSSATAFYKDTEGFILIYYQNISDSSLISGATCNITITDPYANSNTYSATEFGMFYRANYTASFTGMHTYNIICNKTGWTTQTDSGNFNVGSAPPVVEYNIQTERPDTVAGYSCNGTHQTTIYITEVCNEGGYCEEITFNEYELCIQGCTGNVCKRSLVNEVPFWLVFGIVLFIAYVFITRSSLGKWLVKFTG